MYRLSVIIFLTTIFALSTEGFREFYKSKFATETVTKFHHSTANDLTKCRRDDNDCITEALNQIVSRGFQGLSKSE